MVNWWFGARWFGYLGSPYEKDCYSGVPLKSQTINLPLVEILWRKLWANHLVCHMKVYQKRKDK